MPFVIKSIEGKTEVQVRAVLAGVFALAIIGGFFCGLITADSFMPVAIMTISWYFAKKNTDENKPTT